MARQLSIFGRERLDIDRSFSGLRRTELGEGAWVEYAPNWVAGQDLLFEELEKTTRWQRERRQMYDREVETPRLLASLTGKRERPAILDDMRAALAARYQTEFPRVTLALYRDGNDSVAPHGDQVARNMDEALVATVSLGVPRRFLIRPRAGKTHTFMLGAGDLCVMGGTCQRTCFHSVPKVAQAGPRLAIMFRPLWVE